MRSLAWTVCRVAATISLLARLPTAADDSPSATTAWSEDFSSDPFTTGWHLFGETSLFQWNPTQQQLEVTWNSSRPNSYFYRPLRTILTKQDDFSLEFHLRMEQITVGADPAKPFTFQLALGFIRLADATSTNFFRATGMNRTYGPRNLVEFDYFPDSGFGDTWAPTVVSTNNRFAYSNNYPLELTTGDLFQVLLAYRAAEQVLRTTAWCNGQPFGLPPDQILGDVSLVELPDFRVDALAICSYSDAQQSPPEVAGSILARGIVDDIAVSLPEPPVQALAAHFSNEVWQVQFAGQKNWLYTLERSTNFHVWSTVSSVTATQKTTVQLEDADAPLLGAAFYRVRAERP
jgi:hypothetical protein